jgi:membrane-associated phospholipid phosphatase
LKPLNRKNDLRIHLVGEDRDGEAPADRAKGTHITAGVVTLVSAALIFGLIALDVALGGKATLIDARLSAWLHTHSTPGLTNISRLVSAIHSGLIVSAVTVALCVYLWKRRLRDWVLTFLLAVFGGMLLNVALKHLFERLRPSFPDTIQRLTTFSFPSGHTMLAAVFYGTMCAFFVARTRSRNVRALVIIAAVLMMALVGFSRIYLGAHYLTDVLGALAEGFAWLGLCFLIAGIAGKRRNLRSV